MKKINMKRLVGCLTAFLLSSSTILTPLAEANFWKDRRQSVSRLQANGAVMTASLGAQAAKEGLSLLPSLSTGLAQHLSTTSSLDSTAFKNISPQGVNRLPRWIHGLTGSSGVVRRISWGSHQTKAPVVLIEDAHSLYSAQKNIANILSLLDANLRREEQGSLLVGVEGAYGPLNLQPYRTFRNKDVHELVCDLLLKTTLIGGPELFGMTAPQEPQLWGVETPQDYVENVQAYRDGYPQKEALQKSLTLIEQQLASQAPKALSPSALKLEKAIQGFAQGALSPVDYVSVLRPLVQGSFPETDRLVRALQMESRMALPQVDRERSAVVQWLMQRLDPPALGRLSSAAVSYREKQLTFEAYRRILGESMLQAKVDLSAFPAFSTYLNYVSLGDSLDKFALFRELDSLKTGALKVVSLTDGERAFLDLTEDVRLLNQLVQSQLSPQQWSAYLSRKGEMLSLKDRLSSLGGIDASLLPVVSVLAPFEQFYLAAQRRNTSMSANLLSRAKETKASALALVVGGFHTADLEERFSSLGHPVITLTPDFNPQDTSSPAFDGLLVQHVPIEQLLKGEKLFVNPIRATSGMPGMENKGGDLERIASAFKRAESVATGGTVSKGEDVLAEDGTAAMVKVEDAGGRESTVAVAVGGEAEGKVERLLSGQGATEAVVSANTNAAVALDVGSDKKGAGKKPYFFSLAAILQWTNGWLNQLDSLPLSRKLILGFGVLATVASISCMAFSDVQWAGPMMTIFGMSLSGPQRSEQDQELDQIRKAVRGVMGDRPAETWDRLIIVVSDAPGAKEAMEYHINQVQRVYRNIPEIGVMALPRKESGVREGGYNSWDATAVVMKKLRWSRSYRAKSDRTLVIMNHGAGTRFYPLAARFNGKGGVPVAMTDGQGHMLELVDLTRIMSQMLFPTRPKGSMTFLSNDQAWAIAQAETGNPQKHPLQVFGSEIDMETVFDEMLSLGWVEKPQSGHLWNHDIRVVQLSEEEGAMLQEDFKIDPKTMSPADILSYRLKDFLEVGAVEVGQRRAAHAGRLTEQEKSFSLDEARIRGFNIFYMASLGHFVVNEENVIVDMREKPTGGEVFLEFMKKGSSAVNWWNHSYSAKGVDVMLELARKSNLEGKAEDFSTAFLEALTSDNYDLWLSRRPKERSEKKKDWQWILAQEFKEKAGPPELLKGSSFVDIGTLGQFLSVMIGKSGNYRLNAVSQALLGRPSPDQHGVMIQDSPGTQKARDDFYPHDPSKPSDTRPRLTIETDTLVVGGEITEGFIGEGCLIMDSYIRNVKVGKGSIVLGVRWDRDEPVEVPEHSVAVELTARDGMTTHIGIFPLHVDPKGSEGAYTQLGKMHEYRVSHQERRILADRRADFFVGVSTMKDRLQAWNDGERLVSTYENTNFPEVKQAMRDKLFGFLSDPSDENGRRGAFWLVSQLINSPRLPEAETLVFAEALSSLLAHDDPTIRAAVFRAIEELLLQGNLSLRTSSVLKSSINQQFDREIQEDRERAREVAFEYFMAVFRTAWFNPQIVVNMVQDPQSWALMLRLISPRDLAQVMIDLLQRSVKDKSPGSHPNLLMFRLVQAVPGSFIQRFGVQKEALARILGILSFPLEVLGLFTLVTGTADVSFLSDIGLSLGMGVVLPLGVIAGLLFILTLAHRALEIINGAASRMFDRQLVLQFGMFLPYLFWASPSLSGFAYAWIFVHALYDVQQIFGLKQFREVLSHPGLAAFGLIAVGALALFLSSVEEVGLSGSITSVGFMAALGVAARKKTTLPHLLPEAKINKFEDLRQPTKYLAYSQRLVKQAQGEKDSLPLSQSLTLRQGSIDALARAYILATLAENMNRVAHHIEAKALRQAIVRNLDALSARGDVTSPELNPGGALNAYGLLTWSDGHSHTAEPLMPVDVQAQRLQIVEVTDPSNQDMLADALSLVRKMGQAGSGVRLVVLVNQSVLSKANKLGNGLDVQFKTQSPNRSAVLMEVTPRTQTAYLQELEGRRIINIQALLKAYSVAEDNLKGIDVVASLTSTTRFDFEETNSKVVFQIIRWLMPGVGILEPKNLEGDLHRLREVLIRA